MMNRLEIDSSADKPHSGEAHESRTFSGRHQECTNKFADEVNNIRGTSASSRDNKFDHQDVRKQEHPADMQLPKLSISGHMHGAEHLHGAGHHHVSEHIHSAGHQHAFEHIHGSGHKHGTEHIHGAGHQQEHSALDGGPAAPSHTGFAENLLHKIGAPVTKANLTFLDAWQRAEGGSADNPFNTTEHARGAHRFNSAGVQRYDSIATGIEATVKTLENGLYNGVLRALHIGTNAHAAADAVSRTPWGTGLGISRVLR